MPTNTTFFSRFSSNIAEDGAIAVFDVLPDSNIDFGEMSGQDYVNDDPRPSGADFLSADYRFYKIPSSHCSKRSNAYYVNNRTTQYTQFPSVAGLPMNYGGAPRARYKALSDDIVGSEPILLMPSFGMTHEYADRAKTLEMWASFEPYAQASRDNMFSDPVAELTFDTGVLMGGTVSGGTITQVTDATKYVSPNPLNQTMLVSAGGRVTFTDQVDLAGSQTYTLRFAASGTLGETITPRFTITLPNSHVIDYDLQATIAETQQFEGTFDNPFSDGTWRVYSIDFSIDETLVSEKATFSILVESATKLSEFVLTTKENEVVETVIFEQPILEFGGVTGTRVKITADADFMYLYGYGNTANFQVGEWARPMYIVCIDNDKTFDVYVDGAMVMTITKDTIIETYGDVVGEWVVMSLSESFKYADLSTIAFYNAALGQDIQRIHHLFGYGPKYNDVITQTEYDKIYVADGSATTFSSQILFPQTTPFSIGVADGLNISNQLSLPDYPLPTIVNGAYGDIDHYNLSALGYGPQCFAFPENSEVTLAPRDIANDPEYLMIMVSPYYQPQNLLTENQASVETNLTGFSTNNNGMASTLSRVLDQDAPDGNYVLRNTFTSGGTGFSFVQLASVPVTAGTEYTFTFMMKGTQSGNIRGYVDWIGAGEQSLSGFATPSLNWTEIRGTVVAPAGATAALFRVYGTTSVTGEYLDMDKFGVWVGAGGEWSLPSMYSVGKQSGLITRISSDTLGFSCDFKYSAVENDNSKVKVTANFIYPFSAITYADYADDYPSYMTDPNYQRATYTQAAGFASPWFEQIVDRKNFLLVLNRPELQKSSNRDVAAMFGDLNTVYRFNDTCLYTYITVATKESVFGNDILADDEADFLPVQIEQASDTGTVNRHVLGKATYTLYPNNGQLDIAASGQWYVSIPLTNFASFAAGAPDIDFIVYSDQNQSPQLVSSLKTDVMSYDEFETYAASDLADILGAGALTVPGQFTPEFEGMFTTAGYSVDDDTYSIAVTEYDDIQTDADNKTFNYNQMGIDVDTSAPTLGRFANPAVKTFVTIDSPSRWPNKVYSELKIERAGYKNYIDFDASPNSVVDTRWELFDGFALRIPKGINLYKYNLGFGVHLSTNSLRTRKPTFRRADFFGVASGDSPSNQIAVGSGNSIVIGDSEDINLDKPFSTHLVTETVPANYMSRELGFFPHSKVDANEMSPVYFYMTHDDRIKGISFYFNWRSETFRTTEANVGALYEDRIGQIKYLDALNVEHFIDVGVEVPLAGVTTPWVGELKVVPSTNCTIWVDGQQSVQVEAGLWHFVYIDLTADGTVPLSDGGRPVRFAHTNEKAVLNYVASHSVALSPANINASRFGITDQSIFGDDFTANLHFGVTETLIVEDDSKLTLVKKLSAPSANGAVPSSTVRVYLDDNNAVV